MSLEYDNSAVASFASTGLGTNAGVSVTKAAVASIVVVPTHISASGDAAAVVTIESPASTVLWRKRFAAAFNMSENFDTPAAIRGASGSALLVKVSASTSNSEANLTGYTVAG